MIKMLKDNICFDEERMDHWKGNKLKALIEESDTSLFDLSKYLDVSVSEIEEYCKNVCAPDLDVMLRLADYYNVPMDYLLCRCTIKESASILFDWKSYYQTIHKNVLDFYFTQGMQVENLYREPSDIPWPYDLVRDIVDEEIDWETDEALIREILKVLTDDEKEYILALYKDKKTLEEIVEETNCKLNTLTDTINDGIRKLRLLDCKKVISKEKSNDTIRIKQNEIVDKISIVESQIKNLSQNTIALDEILTQLNEVAGDISDLINSLHTITSFYK